MKLSNIYYKMFEIIKNLSIDSAIQAAYEIFNLPVSVSDASFNILAKNSSKVLNNDICWNIPIEEQKVPLEILKIFQDNNIIEVVQNNPRKTIYLNWGWFKDYPRITTSILNKNVIIGYIAVLCPLEEYKPWFDEALQIVADTFSIIMQKEQSLLKNSNVILNSFARDLILGTINNSDLLKWMSLTKLDLKPNYIMMAISTSSNTSYALKILQNELSVNSPHIITYHFNNILYVLIYKLQNKDFKEKSINKISQAIHSLDCFLGMSNEFSKLEEITLYREQAKIALETGQAINPEKNSFVYNDYVLYKIILCAMEKVELQNLIHNSIFIIKDYDEKNNTQYLDTLKNYILNQYSIGNVSKLMHIHRNTLTYRLKKIEELADINLNENQILAHLQLSFYILSIVEKS